MLLLRPRPPSRARSRSLAAVVAGACVLASAACGATTDRGTDAATGTAAGTTAGAPTSGPAPSGTASSLGSTTAVPSTAPGATTTKSGGTASSAVSTTTVPGTDPGTLPQTDEKPSASGSQWDAGTRALWDAIVTDEPDKALPFFFPLSAYKQVKGIANPEHDYDTRLIAYYGEDIHALHKQLGAKATSAQFTRLDVPNAAQWIKPGVEYNKGAYWRVFDSKLVYTIDGVQKSFTVKSLISWRGQWYVVHLTSVR